MKFFLVILLVAMLTVFEGNCYDKVDPDSFLILCSTTDIDCLSKSTKKFLEKTAPGIPEYGFSTIDPLIIPSLDVEVNDLGMVLHFTQINITGLKGQSISDFRIDTDAKSVVLKTKADLHIIAVVNIELTKDSKSFIGLVTSDSSVLGNAQFNYELKPDDKGEEYIEVGPETASCEITEEPNVILEASLKEQIQNDPDGQKVKDGYSANKEANNKKILCEIMKRASKDVFSNIRTATKLFPKTAFFTDV